VDRDRLLQRQANAATILAAFAAILALLFGSVQFERTQTAQRAIFLAEREAKASEFYIAYNTLRADLIRDPSVNAAHEARRQDSAVHYLDAIFHVAGHDSEWVTTVRNRLAEHCSYLGLYVDDPQSTSAAFGALIGEVLAEAC
jgi:hypothetical protein